MIDRVYTKAEARYIPNGPGSTANMAHPTRTGDVVAFAYPPYQFDAATPGHAGRPIGVLRPARLRPRRAGSRQQHQHAGDVPGRRSTRSAKGASAVRSIDIAPTIAYLLGRADAAAEPGPGAAGHAAGGRSVKPLTIIGLNDFHGQLDPTHAPDRRSNRRPSAAPATLATMFDEDAASSARTRRCCWPAATTSAPPRRTPRCCEDKPAIDVENAWGLDATSYGNHEFDYGIERLLMQQERANFPFLATNIVDETHRRGTRLGAAVGGVPVNGVKVGVIGAGLENTPELVSAGRHRGPEVPAGGRADPRGVQRLRRQGVTGADRGDPRGHGATGPTPSAARRPFRGTARSSTHRQCAAGHRRSTRSSPGTPTGCPT